MSISDNWWSPWVILAAVLYAVLYIAWRFRHQPSDKPVSRRLLYTLVPMLDPNYPGNRPLTSTEIIVWGTCIAVAILFVAFSPS